MQNIIIPNKSANYLPILLDALSKNSGVIVVGVRGVGKTVLVSSAIAAKTNYIFIKCESCTSIAEIQRKIAYKNRPKVLVFDGINPFSTSEAFIQFLKEGMTSNTNSFKVLILSQKFIYSDHIKGFKVIGMTNL